MQPGSRRSPHLRDRGRLALESTCVLKQDCGSSRSIRVPDALVRSQLENVLASELFSRSERLSAFLRFVVEETLNGRGETLKEPVLAHQLYGKEADFDGASNPIVRVDARRLRDKLREYYADRRRIPSSSRCRKAAMCRPSSSSQARLPPPTFNLSPPGRTA